MDLDAVISEQLLVAGNEGVRRCSARGRWGEKDFGVGSDPGSQDGDSRAILRVRRNAYEGDGAWRALGWVLDQAESNADLLVG